MARRSYSGRMDRIVGTAPVRVRRYGLFTRLNHWFTAICFLVLMLSGLALFTPALFWLTGLFGGGQTTRWLHPFVGVALSLSFLAMFFQLARLNLPRREDWLWSRNAHKLLAGNGEKLPEVGKYNAGQKLVFWAMSVLILALFVTGIMIWMEYFPDLVAIETRRIAILIHSIAAILIVLVVILHIFAALWTEGTLTAMTRGTVTGGWSWRHHRKWLRELVRRHQEPPAV